MAVAEPFPDLSTLMELIGQAGRRLAEIDASEGAAGNISVFLNWTVDPQAIFPVVETIELPRAAPELVGSTFLVTGSGRRLREISDNPPANLGAAVVNEGGETAQLYTSPARLWERLTSEFNSHLAVHVDQVRLSGTNFHALIHAQPLHLTYLSHIPRYQNTLYLNRHILRWEPECIVMFPEGVGYLPFMVPGSAELMAANVEALRKHRVVLWAKHGVMARSATSVKRACDLIEYAETGARYEYLNLTNHGLADGLTVDEIHAICAHFQVQQEIF